MLSIKADMIFLVTDPCLKATPQNISLTGRDYPKVNTTYSSKSLLHSPGGISTNEKSTYCILKFQLFLCPN